MPNYTLYYFNGRGRAEILRMLFAAADQKYMDKRFEFNEWDKYRNDMPGMCVPCLEMDGGMKMPETMAIARYLSREFGFYGKNNMEMFKNDYICDCFYEIMHDYMRYFHAKNGRFMNSMMSSDGMMSPGSDTSSISSSSSSSSKEMMSPKGTMPTKGMMPSKDMMSSKDMKSSNLDKFLHGRYMYTCNRVLPFLEKTLSMTNGGDKFFMGDQMMWCDMMCYCCLESPYQENQSMLSKYPKLIALRTRVSSHPKISGYLKSRSNSMW